MGCGLVVAISICSTSTLAPVEVRARARRLDASAAVTRLGPEALARARREGLGLAELVDRSAGARVLDEGPLHPARLSVRGGSGAETALWVDGVPMSSPFATGADLGLLGVESIARATLVRGGAGALLGDGALTGALLIESARPEETPPFALALRTGSAERLGLSGAISTGALAIAAELERSGGRFAYTSRRPGLPDAERVRENNDASLGRASLRGEWALGGGVLRASAGGAIREGGAPGFETRPDPDARERTSAASARSAWRGTAFGGALAELSAFGALLSLEGDDPDPLGGRRARSVLVSAGGEGALGLALGAQRLRLGAGGALELARSTEHGAPSRGRAHLVVSDAVALGELELVGALRGAYAGGFELLPRLGLVWTSSIVTLRAAVGRSMRAPAIDELYHPLIGGFSGNPALEPETAWEAELGASFLGSISLAGFARRTFAAIVYVGQNAFLVRPENLGGASALGVELELSRALEAAGLSWEGRAAASAMLSRLDASGAAVPSAPPLSLDLELRASSGALSAYSAFSASSAATVNVAGTISVAPYARWDAGLAWALSEGASLALTVSNLLDVRTLETLFKVPLPGRAALLSLRVEGS